jgi:hypothetical protein
MEVSVVYPNPVVAGGTPVKVDVKACPGMVDWSVWTVKFRPIIHGRTRVEGKATLGWDLRDGKGALVGNGLYYWVFRDGKEMHTRKVMVLK